MVGTVLKFDNIVDWTWSFTLWPTYILTIMFILFTIGTFVSMLQGHDEVVRSQMHALGWFFLLFMGLSISGVMFLMKIQHVIMTDRLYELQS